MVQHGGRYREEPVYVGKHIPPRYNLVPGLMDRFFSFVHENWERETHPTAIAAYALWKINWIHPFNDGNGRTARASCYYLICMKYGGMLPGRKTVPDRIREDPDPYYRALAAADRAWENGHYDLDDLADYLQALLADQLREL